MHEDRIIVVRNGEERSFSRGAWAFMKENGNTQGWEEKKQEAPAELAQLKESKPEEVFPDLLDEIKPDPAAANEAPKAAPKAKKNEAKK